MPVLFRDRSRPVQVLLGGILPAAIGGLAGVLVGASVGAYWAVAALAGIGAFLAGLEHPDGWGGADRGMVGGVIYGTALLLVHTLIGNDAKVSLGSFKPLFVVSTAIAGLLLGAAGGRLGRAMRERAGTRPADERAAG